MNAPCVLAPRHPARRGDGWSVDDTL